jgi:hypothetical protein
MVTGWAGYCCAIAAGAANAIIRHDNLRYFVNTVPPVSQISRNSGRRCSFLEWDVMTTPPMYELDEVPERR